ncbi:MAG TPA: hypothetical protein PKD64_03340 [Pirellulaceae bacterium]|nr:hypothetical protein [Pirellulaceae bacterium]HMO91205.1 hypothetical protein [Pirellulaceae bacterium]HMP71384.1 hypothetical protein [Pirellulaceae bacterium]
MNDAPNEKADANNERNRMIQNGEWEECLKLLKAVTLGKYYYPDRLSSASDIVRSAIGSFLRLKQKGEISPNEEWVTLIKLVNRKRSRNNRRIHNESQRFVSVETMDVISEDENNDDFREDMQGILELILQCEKSDVKPLDEQHNMERISVVAQEMFDELKKILTPEEFFVIRMRLLEYKYYEIADKLVKSGMRSACTRNQAIYMWETAKQKLEKLFAEFTE